MDLLTEIWLISYIIAIPTITVLIGIDHEDKKKKEISTKC